MPRILQIIIIVAFLVLLIYLIISAMSKTSRDKLRIIIKKYLTVKKITISLILSSLSIFISLLVSSDYKLKLVTIEEIQTASLLTGLFGLFAFLVYAIIDTHKYNNVFAQGKFWREYREALINSKDAGAINIVNTADIDDFFSPLGLRYLAEQLVLKPKDVIINRLFVLPDKKKELDDSNIHHLGTPNSWFDYDKMLHNLITLCYQENVNLYFVTEFEIKKLFKSFPFNKDDWDIINIGDKFYKPDVIDKCLKFKEIVVEPEFKSKLKLILRKYCVEKREIEYSHHVKKVLSA